MYALVDKRLMLKLMTHPYRVDIGSRDVELYAPKISNAPEISSHGMKHRV